MKNKILNMKETKKAMQKELKEPAPIWVGVLVLIILIVTSIVVVYI